MRVGWHTAVNNPPQATVDRASTLCLLGQSSKILAMGERELSYCSKGQIKSREPSARDTIAPNFFCCQQADPRF